MNDIAVLWYLDSRRLARGIRDALKSPLRAFGWIGLLLYFILSAYLQSRRIALHGIFPPLSDPVATGILGGHPKCTTCGHLKMYQGSVGT